MEKKSRIKIGGIPAVIFAVFFLIIVVAMKMEVIQDNLMGGFTCCLIIGVGLNWLGDHTPILKNFGFGAILTILLPSILLEVGFFPESVRSIVKNFFSGYDFTSWAIPALLIGSVLAMNRKTLINAGVRFIIPMCGTLVLTTLAMGVIGAAMGYGFAETALYITGPILGSGIGASAVPLASVYAGFTGEPAENYLTILTSSVMLANILTIFASALLGSIGKKNPDFLFKGFSGPKDGDLLRPQKGVTHFTDEQLDEATKDPDQTRYSSLMVGFLICCTIYAASRIVVKYVPTFHFFVYMIVFAIVLKLAGWLPKEVEDASGDFSSFFGKIMVPALMVGISFGTLNIGEILALLTDPVYVSLNVLTILVTIIISGALTYLFGFYFVEGSIMAGLGLADMGGTGDIAILSAANKMYLLPFLTISTRIGGSINMVWLTLLGGMVL